MAGEGSGGIRIPAALAIAVWFGSALAVAGYTVIAFAETASGTSSLNASPPGRGPIASLLPKLRGKGDNGLPLKKSSVAIPTPQQLGVNQWTQGEVKTVNREKFTPSKDASRRKFEKQK